MSDVLFRPYTVGDDDELLRLHNRSFVSQWTREWWDWRYRDLPRGDAAILCAFLADGRCVGMYAGVRLLMQLGSEQCFALSQSDVSVDADMRGGPGRAKLVTRMAKRFFALHTGGETKVTYGFPVPPLRRVISRFVGGQILSDLVFVIHDLHSTSPIDGTVDVRVVERFDDDADELWERERPRFGAAIVRDAAYLNWRYADHPVDYELLEARYNGTGALRGLAVLREGGLDPSVASLAEWLVPFADDAAESALIDHALQYARERRRTGLVAWFPSAGDHFHRFQTRHEFFARATPYQEQFSAWKEGVDRDWLQQNWYQTMGDIDFF